MNFLTLKTPLFHPGENLFSFFEDALNKNQQELKENSVIIIASKIVALSQKRIVLAETSEMETWVKKESEQYWTTDYPGYFLALKNGVLIANAGIDASNSEKGTLILWPENVQQVADELRALVQEQLKLKNIGFVISDSRCTPLRAGVTGVALAWSGFVGVRNEQGAKDLFGKELKVTQNAVADNLTSAAELVMGNANESTPFVICQNAPVEFTDVQQDPRMGVFPMEKDLFSVFWKKENC